MLHHLHLDSTTAVSSLRSEYYTALSALFLSHRLFIFSFPRRTLSPALICTLFLFVVNGFPFCLCAAFEDMLENPLNSTQWMNDPETGPVMLQISRIFQTLNRT